MVLEGASEPIKTPSHWMIYSDQINHGLSSSDLITDKETMATILRSKFMFMARYWQGARLALHVDRLSTHVLSAILCLAKVIDQDGCDVMRLTLPAQIFKQKNSRPN